MPRKKIIVLGDEGSGRSSLLRGLYIPHEIVSFVVKEVEGMELEMHVVRFFGDRGLLDKETTKYSLELDEKAITRSPARGASSTIICCDLSTARSDRSLSYWVALANRVTPTPPLVVGTKADLKKYELESAAIQFGCDYVETSVKKGEHLEEVFTTMAKKLMPSPEPDFASKKDEDKDENEKSSCSIT